VTYLFYLTAFGFLKMENNQIITQYQSHSTPLAQHGPEVTFTKRTIPLIQAFLTITLEKHQLSWQLLLMNSQSGRLQELLLSIVIQYIFTFIFLLGY